MAELLKEDMRGFMQGALIGLNAKNEAMLG